MIQLTKFDGTPIMLNAEWIQSIENTPDTLITLTTGFKLIVRDSVERVVREFQAYQRSKHLSLKGETTPC
jgi:flagellar protein FlbD